jgi:hypothetical protein
MDGYLFIDCAAQARETRLFIRFSFFSSSLVSRCVREGGLAEQNRAECESRLSRRNTVPLPLYVHVRSWVLPWFPLGGVVPLC